MPTPDAPASPTKDWREIIADFETASFEALAAADASWADVADPLYTLKGFPRTPQQTEAPGESIVAPPLPPPSWRNIDPMASPGRQSPSEEAGSDRDALGRIRAAVQGLSAVSTQGGSAPKAEAADDSSQKLFDTLDANGDGVIDREEFRQLATSVVPDAQVEASPTNSLLSPLSS